MSVYELMLRLGYILLNKSYCNFSVMAPKLYLPMYTISQSTVSQRFPECDKLNYHTIRIIFFLHVCVHARMCLHKQG